MSGTSTAPSEVAAGARPPARTIRPERRFAATSLMELYRYRELLAFFVWRDVKVRYKQTMLGAAWAVLQPVLTAVVFTLLFGRMARIPSDGLPYVVFSYGGLVVWTFFAHGVTQAAASLVNSAHLVTKVYFPRIVVPIAAVLGGLVDLAVATSVLVLMTIGAGIPPRETLVLAPIGVLLAITAALAAGVWLAALNVQYRDVRYVVPFLIQLGLFATPVIYPTTEVVTRLEKAGLPGWLFGVNPMAGAVEAFRAGMLGVPVVSWEVVAASAVAAAGALAGGILYFYRVERHLADVV
jgi:lipopolysaccharide transport system permease protein